MMFVGTSSSLSPLVTQALGGGGTVAGEGVARGKKKDWGGGGGTFFRPSVSSFAWPFLSSGRRKRRTGEQMSSGSRLD